MYPSINATYAGTAGFPKGIRIGALRVSAGRGGGTVDIQVANASELGRQLLNWNRMVQSEVGTGPNCLFCGIPRVQRSDYIRCMGCGINWLDEERNLPNYLNRNPAAARSETARMAIAQQKSAGNSAAAADPAPTAGR